MIFLDLDAVLVEFDRLLADGVDELLVDEEDELEARDLQHRVVAQARLGSPPDLLNMQRRSILVGSFGTSTKSRLRMVHFMLHQITHRSSKLTGLPSTNMHLLPSLAM